MTVKQYIAKHGILYDCETGLHRAVSFVIAFTNKAGEDDETEFSVSINDNMLNELDKLFSDFCKENDVPRNQVSYVAIVRTAETMEQLVELESALSGGKQK